MLATLALHRLEPTNGTNPRIRRDKKSLRVKTCHTEATKLAAPVDSRYVLFALRLIGSMAER